MQGKLRLPLISTMRAKLVEIDALLLAYHPSQSSLTAEWRAKRALFEAAGLDRVKPGDAANSYLIAKLAGTQEAVGGAGDRMPSPFGLSQDELDLILDRIADVDAQKLTLAAAREQISEGLKQLATKKALGDAATPAKTAI